MVFVIGLLTFVLVLDCLVLIFLVLLQLPKKEAGAGLAFGGSATDALFGAGSGNVLTKITKYAATTFFILAVVLALLQRTFQSGTRTSEFEKKLNAASRKAAPGMMTNPPSASAQATAPGTNALTIPAAASTNVPILPVIPGTNAGAAAPTGQ